MGKDSNTDLKAQATYDICLCNHLKVSESTGKVIGGNEEPEDITCNAEEYFGSFLRPKDTRNAYAWGKLYRRETIGDARFPVGRAYEDVVFASKIISRVKKVNVISDSLYFYAQRDGSIVNSAVKKSTFDLISAYDYAANTAKKLFPNLSESADFMAISRRYKLLELLIMSSDLSDEQIEWKRSLVRVLRGKTREVLANRYFQPKRKIAAILLLFSSSLYSRVVEMQNQKAKS